MVAHAGAPVVGLRQLLMFGGFGAAPDRLLVSLSLSLALALTHKLT